MKRKDEGKNGRFPVGSVPAQDSDQTHLQYGWSDGKLGAQQKLEGQIVSRRIRRGEICMSKNGA
nr:hypothetical protein [uncultured Fretibacterium sp.]